MGHLWDNYGRSMGHPRFQLGRSYNSKIGCYFLLLLQKKDAWLGLRWPKNQREQDLVYEDC
jgi:hypothetical protein